ncbi:MAG: ATP-binding protein [Candidatus Delongbacteria bacterium]|nr:ATP-binding protein [Candidatus Delongbacteria bacterium]
MEILLLTQTPANFDLFISHSQELGHQFVVSNHSNDAIDIFFQKNIKIVFFDFTQCNPEMIKFLEQLQLSERDFVSVFFINHYDAGMAFRLLGKRIDFLLFLPGNMDEMMRMCHVICNYKKNGANALDHKSLDYEYKRIIIGNEFNNLQNIIRQMTINLPKICKSPKKIELALYEIIVNAIEHGNLAISGDEKKTSIQNNSYYDLLKDRKNDPRFRERKVVVETALTHEHVEYVIQDDGQGFDWRGLLNSHETMDILNEHGRGILMVKNIFDYFEYNEKGNIVKLIKYSDFISESRI